MRTAAIVALLSLLLVSADAKEVCFKHTKTRFIDKGALGGFAQRAFVIAHTAIMDKLKCQTTLAYKLGAGCYKTLEAVGTKDILGEYGFKYTFTAKCGKKVVRCSTRVATMMTRWKELVAGKARLNCK